MLLAGSKKRTPTLSISNRFEMDKDDLISPTNLEISISACS